ncbi:MAG: DUF2752 domain-containing protein [Clostridia bacterium]|nr:DUF2752 domain-containing protein [Clostridia bacterium]
MLKSGFAMKCPFYVHLGILCPGCGMTRALRALLSGQFWESILLNPFALLATVLGILLYVEQWFRFFLKEVHLLPRNKWFYIILCSCLLLYWVLRNIPLFSFLSIA